MLTHIGNEEWNQGFLDGYNGVEHREGRGDDYDNGYSRGYATSETESANNDWEVSYGIK